MNRKERRALYARLLVDPAVLVLDHRRDDDASYGDRLESTVLWVHLTSGSSSGEPRERAVPWSKHIHDIGRHITVVTVEFGGLKAVADRIGKFRTYSNVPDKAAALHEVAMGLPIIACEKTTSLLDNFHEYNKL